MGAVEVEAFLTYLAVVGRVAASTQNQALSALLYLYREVLSIELPWLDNVVRAKTQQRLSVVLTRQEVNAVLNGMSEVYALMARLLYETGMRLMESMRLGARMIYQSDAFGGSPVLQGGVSRSPDRPERPSGRRRIVRIWAGWCSPVQIFVRSEPFRRTLDH
jgi:hypothetical protein